MFTFSRILLEDRENLFQDFWSPFSISFLTFSARLNFFLKNREPPYGQCPTRTPQPGRPFKPRSDPAPAQVAAAPQTLTLTDPRRRRRRPRRRHAVRRRLLSLTAASSVLARPRSSSSLPSPSSPAVSGEPEPPASVRVPPRSRSGEG